MDKTVTDPISPHSDYGPGVLGSPESGEQRPQEVHPPPPGQAAEGAYLPVPGPGGCRSARVKASYAL